MRKEEQSTDKQGGRGRYSHGEEAPEGRDTQTKKQEERTRDSPESGAQPSSRALRPGSLLGQNVTHISDSQPFLAVTLGRLPLNRLAKRPFPAKE